MLELFWKNLRAFTVRKALRLNTSVGLMDYEDFNDVHVDTFGPLNGCSESVS
jgi:hypothetical protein